MGPQYTSIDGSYSYGIGFIAPSPSKSPLLLDSSGKFFERSKPQYETLSAGGWVIATDHGISNDATGDQSDAINTLLANNVGAPIFFPAGIYMAQNTVFIPTGSVLVGEGESRAFGSSNFSDPDSRLVTDHGFWLKFRG